MENKTGLKDLPTDMEIYPKFIITLKMVSGR